MNFFKKIILRASNRGLIVSNPFANYKVVIKKVDRGYLTQQELDLLMNKEFPTKRLEQVRDIFVFSCYTGLAYIDVHNLKISDFQVSFDNKIWIIKNRQKTDIQSRIPLLEVPEMIIEKYNGRKLNAESIQAGVTMWNTFPKNRLLPVLSNQKTNSYLHEIADICGIQKNLTFHLARHTFATTVTLSKGVPIETVSKMLGHTNIQTTQIYARITDDKIGRDMENLAEKLKEDKVKDENKLLECKFDKLPINIQEQLFNSIESESLLEKVKAAESLWENLSVYEKTLILYPISKQSNYIHSN